MREVEPEVYLIGRPNVDVYEMRRYLEDVGGTDWLDRVEPLYELTEPDFSNEPDDIRNNPEGRHGEALVEFGGRLCYRSWEPGLNANVTKVREDSEEYLANILRSGHGSVTEHGFYVFLFHNVSRVFTHELVRHRAGTSISQESMRFVRLTDIPFWMPEWAKADPELYERNLNMLRMLEDHQVWMAEHFGLDATKVCPACDGSGYQDAEPDGGCPDCLTCSNTGLVSAVPFEEKKHKTSFMRRFAPDGVATSIMWGVNIRAARHTVTMRANHSAEEEIDLVFRKVYETMGGEAPFLFGDFLVTEDGAIPEYRKV